MYIMTFVGLPQWFSSKESACNAGDAGDPASVPESGKSPGKGHGNPLQYSRLESPTDPAAWWAIVHRITKSRTQLKRLSTARQDPDQPDWALILTSDSQS